jgi:hypothetical protein
MICRRPWVPGGVTGGRLHSRIDRCSVTIDRTFVTIFFSLVTIFVL